MKTQDTFKVVLLAAGLGTRLKPITEFLPKCLVPIYGKPLLEHWLDLLETPQVSEIIINTHHFSELFESFIASSPHKSKVRLVHEKELLGTGGTLLSLKERLCDGPFMVAHADNLSLFDVEAFAAAHFRRPENCEMTMMTFQTDTPRSCGIVELDDLARVVGFHEKVQNPPGNNANAAVFMMQPEILKSLEAIGNRFIEISTELLPSYIGRIVTYENDLYHRDIGTLQSWKQAHADFREKLAQSPWKPSRLMQGFPSKNPNWQSYLLEKNIQDEVNKFLQQ